MANNKAPGAMNVARPFKFSGGTDASNVTGSEDDEDGFASYNRLASAQRLDILTSLPAEQRPRIAALRKLQVDIVNISADFYKEVHALEAKYASQFDKVYAQRNAIVNGLAEPSEEDAKFPLFSDAENELAEKFAKQVTVTNGETTSEKTVGVPNFWAKVLHNIEITNDMIEECDEDILTYLSDIGVIVSTEPMSFTLEFHWKPNPYFTNEKLTKTYLMKCAADMKDPADFDGPEIIKTTGCKIDWKEGKDVTVKLVKKKQKNKKQAGATRFVTKQVKTDSFFNFFNPPEHTGNEMDEDMDDNDRMLLHLDFEIGQTIRDTIVPHALFHFTGEASVDDEEDEDDYGDEDEGDDEDGTEDDEEEE